jgi:hypothetical protein
VEEPEHERARDDSDEGWGDAAVERDLADPASADRHLVEDRPPHHDRP